MSEYIRTNKFDPNECPNIFVQTKLTRMNLRINIRAQYIRIFEYSNIFVTLCFTFEKTFAHSFRGEATQVCAMQLLNQSGWSSKNTHYDTHWGKASSMRSVWIFFKYINRYEETQDDPLWGKTSEMFTMWLFKHLNWPFDNPHEEYTHWRKAIQMWPMRQQFCFS